MNKIGKVIISFFMMLSLVACGGYEDSVNLSKDGAKYEVDDRVSLYYPKKWETVKQDRIDQALNASETERKVVKDAQNLMIEFFKGEEFLRFTRQSFNNDNTPEELIELYCDEMELQGFVVTVVPATLNNGVNCYEVLSEYKADLRKFKAVIVYSKGIRYMYIYGANQQTYDKKVEGMTKYLYSLEIKDE